MSAASNYLEKALLDHLLVNTAYSAAANLYIGLFTADPGESGVTSEFTIGSGAYARAVVANNVTNFPPCAITGTPTKSNAGIITFPTATAAWGTATHWAIFENASEITFSATTNGTTTITVGDTTGLKVGASVHGSGIPTGAYIVSMIANTSITINAAATNSTTTNRTAHIMIAHGAIGTSHVIQTGKTVKILAGSLVFTLTNATKGGLTDYSKRGLLDLVFGAVTFTPSATIYLGAGTDLTGDTLTEWTESTYARSAIEFTAATLGAGTCPNTNAETLCSSVADAGPFTITHYGIWDDATSGNLLVTGQINASKIVNNGDSFAFAAGAVVATLQ